MKYILFDDQYSQHFFPLSSTRSVADFRLGITTIGEKWAQELSSDLLLITQEYLQPLYTLTKPSQASFLYINSSYLPEESLLHKLHSLPINTLLKDEQNNRPVAFHSDQFFDHIQSLHQVINHVDISSQVFQSKEAYHIKYRWDIFQKNHEFILQDIDRINKKNENNWVELSSTNRQIGKNPVYVQKGAYAECSIFNTQSGPVFLSAGSEVMEGCLVRGSLALCEGASLKMGAKIYGATTIGPQSKVGGEVNNSVIFGFSNKAHDGFLGNSVLAEWCNLGADTNNSNLKNNYSAVEVWDYSTNDFIPSHQQFIGLCMGDHSKTGINTMLNTGTVVGIFANIYGSDFPDKFVPDFSWGSPGNWQEHKITKALDMAEKVMSRRNVSLSPVLKEVYQKVYEQTKSLRPYSGLH